MTNLTIHSQLAFAAGFIAAILALNVSWMPSPLAGALIWAAITIIWELGQWAISRFTLAYLRRKWKDSLADIIVGNLAFLLPWLVISLGTYHGNTMRPSHTSNQAQPLTSRNCSNQAQPLTSPQGSNQTGGL